MISIPLCLQTANCCYPLEASNPFRTRSCVPIHELRLCLALTLLNTELTKTKRPIMYIELLRVQPMRKKYGYKMSLLRGVCAIESAIVHTRLYFYNLIRFHRHIALLLSIAFVYVQT